MAHYVSHDIVVLRSVAPGGKTHLRRVRPGVVFSTDAPKAKGWIETDPKGNPIPRVGKVDEPPPVMPKRAPTRADVDAMDEPALRAFITEKRGKPPHHMLGEAKLRAEAHLLNEGGVT